MIRCREIELVFRRRIFGSSAALRILHIRNIRIRASTSFTDTSCTGTRNMYLARADVFKIAELWKKCLLHVKPRVSSDSNSGDKYTVLIYIIIRIVHLRLCIALENKHSSVILIHAKRWNLRREILILSFGKKLLVIEDEVTCSRGHEWTKSTVTLYFVDSETFHPSWVLLYL